MARKPSKKALSKLLDKAGVEDIKDLSPEELETYKRYKLTLTKEITVQDIKEFCTTQLRVIENRSDGVTPLTMLQQACIHVYINFLKLIEAPEAERESLERMLNQMAEDTGV